MHKLYRFWKKDFVNKLIVLVVFLIAAAIAIDLYLLITPKTSGTSLLADLFPSPTTDLKVIVTSKAETAAYQAAMATASVPPTITTIPLTPRPMTATFTPTPATPSPTFPLYDTPEQPQTTPEAPGAPEPTPTSSAGIACLPTATVQTGKAVDIIDGATIKVLIDGLVYTVRYIGIALPENENIAGRASSVNGSLVFGKEISLIADNQNKDNLGRLLRYVKVEQTFVNLELLWQGLATTEGMDPLLSCAQAFKDAEQAARDAQRGIWKIAPVP